VSLTFFEVFGPFWVSGGSNGGMFYTYTQNAEFNFISISEQYIFNYVQVKDPGLVILVTAPNPFSITNTSVWAPN
jgi:hypothetical protein